MKIKRCSKCSGTGRGARAVPEVVIELVVVGGARFSSEGASFPSSRLFGDQRDDDLSVDVGVVVRW